MQKKDKTLHLSLDLLKLLLPELLVSHFDIVKHDSNKEVLHLYFEEKKDTPKEEEHRSLTAHGFHKEIRDHFTEIINVL
ncbi:hypothetical protein ABI125_01775 [Tamlana crocina]|uniref:hypothetical protein n=1 Tax=Tamlana crocina TaxID=393006 RepID=UPI001FD86610|nr:hypothetical protein [Tamlana crocina]